MTKCQLANLLNKIGVRASCDAKRVEKDPSLVWVVSERFVNARSHYMGNFSSYADWAASVHAEAEDLARKLSAAGLVTYSTVDFFRNIDGKACHTYSIGSVSIAE